MNCGANKLVPNKRTKGESMDVFVCINTQLRQISSGCSCLKGKRTTIAESQKRKEKISPLPKKNEKLRQQNMHHAVAFVSVSPNNV